MRRSERAAAAVWRCRFAFLRTQKHLQRDGELRGRLAPPGSGMLGVPAARRNAHCRRSGAWTHWRQDERAAACGTEGVRMQMSSPVATRTGRWWRLRAASQGGASLSSMDGASAADEEKGVWVMLRVRTAAQTRRQLVVPQQRETAHTLRWRGAEASRRVAPRERGVSAEAVSAESRRCA